MSILRLGLLFLSVVFIISLSVSPLWASLLILEVQEEVVQPSHAEQVSHIACSFNISDCVLQFSVSFDESEYVTLQPLLASATVINLSLGFQKPEQMSSVHNTEAQNDYQDKLDVYNQQVRTFDKMFIENSSRLFVVAAGNGFSMMGMSTQGVPLSRKYSVLPAYSLYENTIKVASINKMSLEEVGDGRDVSLMDYSNYSLTHVDVAAPVEPDAQGNSLRGTSFAAPYVSRLAYRILQKYPQLSPPQIIEILIKSSMVVNLERAIEISQDIRDQGKESLWGRLENKARGIKEREALRAEIGPILLVKSGGVVMDTAAEECARRVIEEGLTVEKSCLLAHQSLLGANMERQEQLKQLWRLREL